MSLNLAPGVRRLEGITLGGADLRADVVDAVVGTPTLELSGTQTSELRLGVYDPDLEVLGSGLFRRRTPATVLGMPFEVAAVEVGGDAGPEVVTVTLRSAGVQRLKRARGTRMLRNVSRTDYARTEARDVGLGFRGQPSAKVAQVGRQAADKGSDADAETAWDALTRHADEAGDWTVAEAGGVLTFASAKWLLANPPATWRIRWRTSAALPRGDVGALTTPNVRQSEDADDDGTLDVQVPREQGIDVRPGDALVLGRELPEFGGLRFLCQQVTIPVDGWSPVTLSGSRPT